MSDVILDEVDARARAAGLAERRSAAQRRLPDAPAKPGWQWVRPALVAAAVVLTIGGLVVIAQRDTSSSDDEQTVVADTRYVIGDVVDGYEPVGAVGPGSGAQGVLPTLLWFGPSDVDRAVSLAVDTSDGHDDEWLDSQLLEYVDDPTEARVGGRRVILTDSTEFGALPPRVLFVEVADNRWVSAISRGVDDSALQRLAAGFTVGPDGQVVLDDAFLPDGLKAVGVGPVSMLRGFLAHAPATSDLPWPLHQSGVLYMSSVGSSGGLALYIAPEDGLLRAQAVLIAGAPSPTGRSETQRYTAEVLGGNELLWDSNGVSFALYATSDVSLAEMEAMADSVRPASASEWSDLEAELVTFREQTLNPTTLPAAEQVLGTFDRSLVGSVIGTGSLSDGRVWTATLGASDDDKYLVDLAIDGEFTGSWGTLDNALFGVISAQFGDVDLVLAAWPASAADGTELRVSNTEGESAAVPLVPFTPIPDVAFAVHVGVHAGTVVGELVDDSGEVLARS
jgi:hypothetical protein